MKLCFITDRTIMDSAFDINFVFPVSKSDEVVIFFDFLNLHLSIGSKA